MYWPICGIIAVVTLFATPAAAAPADDYKTCANASGEIAITACTRAITSGRYPGKDLARLYLNRGLEWRHKNDIERAMSDYDEAIRIFPDYDTAYNARCFARAISGRQLRLALDDCSASLRLRPAAPTFDNRGLTYLLLGDLDSAIADYNAALRLDPKLADSLYGRGIAKLRKGDRAGGDADITAAKGVDAKIAETFAKYGVK